VIAAIGCVFSAAIAIVNIFATRTYLPGEIFRQPWITIADLVIAAMLGIVVVRPDLNAIFVVVTVLLGFLNILDGGDITGCLLYLLGWSLALTKGFFKSSPKLKLGLVLACAILPLAAQLRFGVAKTLDSMVNIGFMILMATFVMLILRSQLSELLPDKVKRKRVSLAPYGFTPQELEMIRMVMEDQKYVAIATRFEISESKVKQQMLDIYQRLGVAGRTEFQVLCSTTNFIFPGK
jgi:DNA-binding CsgD family transcriptional regulator